MLSGAVMSEYLERLVPLQGAADDNRDRLNDIKQEARSDGLNIDAINALLPLLTKYPHDKAAGVLNEVIRYAEAFGTESLVSQGAMSSYPVPTGESDVDVSQPATAGALGRKSTAYAPLRLSVQVVAAMSVSVGLLWLLK